MTNNPDLNKDGAQLYKNALLPREIKTALAAIAKLPSNKPGIRLQNQPWLAPLIGPNSAVAKLATQHLTPSARPVRAILFDKNPSQNWALGWHQDRTIAVKSRIETPGFGPWTIKSAIQHVEPPVEFLKNMRTYRIHLDLVSTDNAPLFIATGSHQHGRVTEEKLATIVDQLPVMECLADAGDIWAYHTLIFHGSRAAKSPNHRRVLQVDFSADELPNGLEWMGV